MSVTLAAGDDDTVDRVCSYLAAGELAVLPSDTVYVIAADAFAPAATHALQRAKGRGLQVPLGLLLRTQRQLIGLASSVSEAADRLLAGYWPGPLTLIMPAAEGLSAELGETKETLALRQPADALVASVIGEIGPLAVSAANIAREPVGETCDAVRAVLSDEVACYVDGGPRPGPRSTVVDCTGEAAWVRRAGAIAAEDVERVARGDTEWGTRPEPE